MTYLVVALLLTYLARVVWRAARAAGPDRIRILRVRLAPVALIYLGIMLMLMFLENKIIYHPCTCQEDWEEPDGSGIEDVWLTSAAGTRLHGWWFPNPATQWSVLYSHGNAGNLSHRQEFCRAFQQLGASVLIYDYPGYGRSAGRPSEAGCLAAARAAYAWLREQQKIPTEQLVLFGESIGGAMAIDLAVNQPHRALVLYAAFTSVADMAQDLFPWLPARWLVRTRYDNLEKIRHYSGPLFIAHGTADAIVPFRQGRRLFEAAPSNPHNCFFPIEGRNHNDGLVPEVFEAIHKFLLHFSSSHG
jgi:fermentation-respiration switch protein FrsA (DUF1100 family)